MLTIYEKKYVSNILTTKEFYVREIDAFASENIVSRTEKL